MPEFLDLLTPAQVFAAALFGILAGLVKGVVGFAVPTVLISGLSSFLAPDIALAALILPAFFSNSWQAFRQGWDAVLKTIREFWRFLCVGFVFVTLSSQLMGVIESKTLLVFLGAVVTSFAIFQLYGAEISLPPTKTVEFATAALVGSIGGVSGIWGPPTVVYLTALKLKKADSIRVQGVIYTTAAAFLFIAHFGSGVLNAKTLPLSFAMVFPVLLGLWIGFQIQDRLDQRMFHRATLIVLIIAGLNLLRRALV